jgi:hypothetical protein
MPTYNETATTTQVEMQLNDKEIRTITEAESLSGRTKDELANEALRDLLKRIREGGEGHFHAIIQ